MEKVMKRTNKVAFLISAIIIGLLILPNTANAELIWGDNFEYEPGSGGLGDHGWNTQTDQGFVERTTEKCVDPTHSLHIRSYDYAYAYVDTESNYREADYSIDLRFYPTDLPDTVSYSPPHEFYVIYNNEVNIRMRGDRGENNLFAEVKVGDNEYEDKPIDWIPYDEWSHIEIEVDTSEKEYTVTVDNELKGTYDFGGATQYYNIAATGGENSEEYLYLGDFDDSQNNWGEGYWDIMLLEQ